MNKIKLQLKFGWRLSAQRILSIRMLTLLLLLGCVYHIFLAPLKRFTEAVQYPVCPVIFPFLLSDLYFLVLFLAAAVYYFSDAPFMKGWTMYQVVRTGRVRWALGQMEAVVISAFSFVLLAAGMTGMLLWPDVALGEGWGKALYTLSMTGISGDFDIPFGISYEIIGRYTVWEALTVTILISGMVLTFIGLLMFCISLMGSRLWANMSAMVFVIMPVVQQNIGADVPRLKYFSPVSWMRISELRIGGGGSGVPFGYCIAALGTACILLSAAILWKIKTVDFQ